MPDNRLKQLRAGYATDDYFSGESPYLGPLRALAGREELAYAVGKLANSCGRPLPGDDPLATVAAAASVSRPGSPWQGGPSAAQPA